MRLFQGVGIALVAACSLSLSACATRSYSVADPAFLPAAGTAAAIADSAGVAPPSAISPGAKTLADDRGIIIAFQTLDVLASAADTILAVKPSVAGTPAAYKLADALDAARHSLNAASQAQRAQQATSYKAALEAAAAAMTSAKAALATIKGK